MRIFTLPLKCLFKTKFDLRVSIELGTTSDLDKKSNGLDSNVDKGDSRSSDESPTDGRENFNSDITCIHGQSGLNFYQFKSSVCNGAFYAVSYRYWVSKNTFLSNRTSSLQKSTKVCFY